MQVFRPIHALDNCHKDIEVSLLADGAIPLK